MTPSVLYNSRKDNPKRILLIGCHSEFIAAVCDQFPDAKILEMPTLSAGESILAEFGPEMVICSGAEFEPLLRRGSFASAIRRLTPRQRELLPLVIKGLSNREIAQIAGVSERLVRSEVSELLDTFEASNRTELAMLAGAGA